MIDRSRVAVLLLIIAVLVSACAGAEGKASPTAPTAGQTVGTPGSPVGSISGQTAGTNAPADATGTTAPPTQNPPTAPPGMSVAMGAVSGVTGTCPSLKLTIDGKAVVTDARTRFDGGTCEAMKTATQGAAGGVKQTDGSILAQVVRVGTMAGPQAPPPGQGRVQGLISDVTGSCPLVALKIGGKAVKVDGQTKFERGSCADVKNGVQGGAIGKLVDGVLVAERAIVATQPTTPGPGPGPMPGPPMTIIQGIVTVTGGGCGIPPTLTFTVDGKAFQLDARTRIEGGTCADVKTGVKVAAGGIPQASGVILAAGVKIGGR